MTVIPVVDYEPCAVAAGTHPVGTRPTGRDDRSRARHQVALVAPTPPSAPLRHAAGVADAALRGILEVIDRRRSPAHLRGLLSAGLVDSVSSYARAGSGGTTSAVLRRVRLQAVCPDERAFEVSATYSRGRRVHAVACRVQRNATEHGETWQVVALHLG
jgi:Family of unknown function (DUF6459)